VLQSRVRLAGVFFALFCLNIHASRHIFTLSLFKILRLRFSPPR